MVNLPKAGVIRATVWLTVKAQVGMWPVEGGVWVVLGMGKSRFAWVRPSVPPNPRQTNLTECMPVRLVTLMAGPDASLGGLLAGRESSGIATDWVTRGRVRLALRHKIDC